MRLLRSRVYCLDYSVWAGYCVCDTASLGAIVFKNETERAFLLVMPMCRFALLSMTVKDAVFAG